MKRKIATLTLALALMFSLSVPAFAATRWGEAANIVPRLSFSGSTATCNVTITGKSGTSEITATVSLQRENSNGTYSSVKSWEKTIYGERWTLDSTALNCASGSYRLVVSATVYDANGNSESAGETAYASC